jgi:3-hydroxyacyl-CoA dehydrogenase/enoyl-CoA hydratase/3-hydroxybutyryl-CoA epimerase
MQDIAPTLDYSGFGSVDLVVEAVVEKMSVKKTVLREAEKRTPAGCTLTSNTSTLSITEMQDALEHPADFCGMHFFNPVHRMPLVEVIRGAKSSDATIARVFALARRLDKTPIIVNDGPGFLVNRILSPYLNEAGWLLADGATVEAIDEALLEFGMPMGPLRLLDEVGLDVSRHAGAVLHEAFGERMAPAPTLTALQDSGLLGKKGGRGFYTYEDDTAKGVNESIHDLLGDTVPTPPCELARALIIDRAVLAMVNEAARVLEDGIVDGPGEVDLGMITGTGFPPFRGGLLRWADTLGLPVVLKRLETFERDYGPRFAPARSIRERAAALRGFYD